MKKQELDLPKALVICGAIIGVLLFAGMFFLSQADIYIKSIGGSELSDGKIPNTISVRGEGKVFAKPDMLTFQTAISELSSSSEQSLDRVNQKVSEITKILKEQGVSDNDIQTSNLSIYTEYDYDGNTRRVRGQRASQTLSVKVKKVDEKAKKAAVIIDKLSSIENIAISNITFDIENKDELVKKAREEAFKDAEKKATELANVGKVNLLKPISITDSYVNYRSPVYDAVGNAEDSAAGSSKDTQISTGELEININLSVLFGID